MNALTAVVELRAWPRALDHRAASARIEARWHPVVAAVDFGREFDKEALHVNVARADPWLLRAAERPWGPPDGARARVYARLLQLFALAQLERLQRKLALPAFAGVLLTVAAEPHSGAAVDDGETLAGACLDNAGRAAIQAVRARFIAGEAPTLLASTGYRLVPLIERAAAAQQ